VKIDGQFVVHAPRLAVWEMLNDPAVLARTIPGCERLDPAGEHRFDVVVKAGIGAIKGTYRGTVKIEDLVPPDSYVLSVDGSGPGGFIKGRGHISLTDAGTDTTVSVAGEAQAGGVIASVGQRLLGSGAKLMMNEFFQGLEREAKRAADIR
jgi:uncharacterized protein